MKRVRRMIHKPSPAMVVAIISLVVAMTGTAVAAKKLGLGDLDNKAKDKTVGVGKLTYVTATTNATAPTQPVNPAQCPSGLQVIGGGIKLSNPGVGASLVADSHPSGSGWAGVVLFTAPTQSATTTAICAVSRKVTGSPGG